MLKIIIVVSCVFIAGCGDSDNASEWAPLLFDPASYTIVDNIITFDFNSDYGGWYGDNNTEIVIVDGALRVTGPDDEYQHKANYIIPLLSPFSLSVDSKMFSNNQESPFGIGVSVDNIIIFLLIYKNGDYKLAEYNSGNWTTISFGQYNISGTGNSWQNLMMNLTNNQQIEIYINGISHGVYNGATGPLVQAYSRIHLYTQDGSIVMYDDMIIEQ